jgi:hypothetical protein
MPTIQLARIQPATGDIYFTTTQDGSTEGVASDTPSQTNEAAKNAPVIGTWRQQISKPRLGHSIVLRPWP